MKKSTKKKILKVVLIIIFLPFYLSYLLLKSNASAKAKIGGLAGIWFGAMIITSIASSTSNQTLKDEPDTRTVSTNGNVTTVATSAIKTPIDTVTQTTAKVAEPVTTPLSDNPLMNLKFTDDNTGYDTTYGFVSTTKSTMNGITAQQLKEYFDKYSPDHTWVSIKFTDGTGLYSLSGSGTFIYYGIVDEQGGITDANGYIEIENDKIIIRGKDESVIDEFSELNNDAFTKMNESAVTEPVTEAPPEPEPEPEPELAPVERAPRQVYIAASGKGKKYHYDPYCSNMNNEVIAMSVEEAEAQGYTMCGKE